MTACLTKSSCGVSSVEEGHGIAERPLRRTRTMARVHPRTIMQAPSPRVGPGRGHAPSTMPTTPFLATLHATRWLTSCTTPRTPDIVSGAVRYYVWLCVQDAVLSPSPCDTSCVPIGCLSSSVLCLAGCLWPWCDLRGWLGIFMLACLPVTLM